MRICQATKTTAQTADIADSFCFYFFLFLFRSVASAVPLKLLLSTRDARHLAASAAVAVGVAVDADIQSRYMSRLTVTRLTLVAVFALTTAKAVVSRNISTTVELLRLHSKLNQDIP